MIVPVKATHDRARQGKSYPLMPVKANRVVCELQCGAEKCGVRRITFTIEYDQAYAQTARDFYVESYWASSQRMRRSTDLDFDELTQSGDR